MKPSRICSKSLILASVLFLLFSTVAAWTVYCAVLPPDPDPPPYFLFTFHDLSEGEHFTSSHQPYADYDGDGRGINIATDLMGVPEAVSATSTNLVIKNVGTNEFGTSEFSNLLITFNGFIADVVDVQVGLLGSDTFPVTAHLRAYYMDSLVASDSVDLGSGPTSVQHSLRVEIADTSTEAIDRIMISYGYTGGGAQNAQQSEVIDDLYIHLLHEPPEPPPPDLTDPVIHILEPLEGDTVDSGWIMGYVVEDRGLDSILLEKIPTGDSFYVTPLYSVVGDEERYLFYGRLPVNDGENTFRVTAEDLAANDTDESVTVTYVAPDYCPPPPEWPPALNFEATGIEVTQAIQSWTLFNKNLYNPVTTDYERLAAGKTTLVRVYADVYGTEDPIPDVDCRLHAYDASWEEVEGSPIYPVNLVTIDPDETWVEQRQDTTKSFNFFLPPEWTYGYVRLRATVNEWNAIPEAVYNDFNNAWADCIFTETDDFCIFTYPIHSKDEGDVTPSWPEIEANLAYLRQIYPVTPENLIVHRRSSVSTDLLLATGNDEDDFESLGDLLDDFRRGLSLYYGLAEIAYCNHDAFLGLTHDSVRHRGVTDSYRPVSLSVARDTAYFKIKTAHEIGHGRGLGHVDSDTPDCSSTNSDGEHEPKEPYEAYAVYHRPDYTHYFDASLGNYGVRFDGGNTFSLLDPETVGDLMSYCGTRWMSTYTWRRLFEIFAPGAVSSTANTDEERASDFDTTALPADYLIVGGSVKPSGLFDTDIAILDPLWQRRLPAGSSDHVGKGDYAIILKDGAGKTLFTRYFTPLPKLDVENHASFYELLPAKAGTRSVSLTGPNLIKSAVIKAGGAAPSVDVTYPDGGEVWGDSGLQYVSWTASDADDDDLTYVVFYSNDDGQTWQVIRSDLKTNLIFLWLQDLPGGTDSCLIQVRATDGINMGADISDEPFTKGGTPPTATIIGPKSGMAFKHEDMILFEGMATDLEDGAVPKDHITWRSNRDGDLGQGPVVGATNLAAGVHTITLTVEDYDGLTASDIVYIYVAKPAPQHFDEGDCDVDGEDLERFAAQFNLCKSDCFGDVEPDNDLDIVDLHSFAGGFGYACPPASP